MPTRAQHIQWAKENEADYAEALERWEQTGNPVFLADAIRAGYGVQLNRMDAGQRELAAEAVMAQGECRDLLLAELQKLL